MDCWPLSVPSHWVSDGPEKWGSPMLRIQGICILFALEFTPVSMWLRIWSLIWLKIIDLVSSRLPLAVPHVLSATPIRTGRSFLCYQKHNRPYKPEYSLPSSVVLIPGPSGCTCTGQSLEVRWCAACWWREHWCLMVACYFRLVVDDNGRNVPSPFLWYIWDCWEKEKKRKRNPNLFLTKKLENELLKVMRPGCPGPLDDGQKSAVLRLGSDVPLPVECCLWPPDSPLLHMSEAGGSADL